MCIQFVKQFLANVNLPTPDDGCGYSKAENHRIVGGSTAKRGKLFKTLFSSIEMNKFVIILTFNVDYIGAWPWLARIGANNETGDVFYHCGKKN